MDSLQEDIKKYNKSIPPILYKYKKWSDKTVSFEKEILINRKLFFPSPLAFNDPFDCTIPMLATGKYEDLYNRACEFVRKDNPTFKKETIHRFAKKLIEEGHYCNFDEQKQVLLQNIRLKYGVCSLTTKNNNLVMWSHYADSHKGICLGFDVKSIVKRPYYINTKVLKLEIVLLCYKVDYYDKYPQLEYRFFYRKDNEPITLKEFNEMTKPLLSKSSHWQYEDEYRILSLQLNNYGIIYEQSDLKSVYLGYRMEREQKSELLKILKKQFPKTEVYQSVIKEKEFGLRFDRIR